MKKGELVYYAKDEGTEKPIGPANGFKTIKPKVGFLWGDPFYVISATTKTATVSAKGHHFKLPVSSLMTTPLLSLYQIDCGQGDAALIHTPDDRWLMIDGGPSPSMSNSPALGTQFLWWKIFVDQSWRSEFKVPGPFRLDSLIVSHPDEDHFGGFPRVVEQVKAGKFEIGTLFHCGMGRFAGEETGYDGAKGFSQLGPLRGKKLPDAVLTTLLDDAKDVARYAKTETGRPWKLHGNYADFLKAALAKVGKGIGSIQRVGRDTGHLPGYGPGTGSLTCHVLGPVIEKIGSHQGLRFLDSASNAHKPSLTRNGHSIVLRFDYDKFRLVMTGDLNFESHAVLLKHVPKAEFACHVAKACHHGSDKISTTFLQALNPLATLFSSGDNESHAHPRAKALAFSARCSQVVNSKSKKTFLDLSEPEQVAPLIYSTELSRSVGLYAVEAVLDGNGKRVSKAQIQPKPRALNPKTKPDPLPALPLKDWYISNKLIYGLINVRTDGKKVVIGVLKESDEEFQIEKFTL